MTAALTRDEIAGLVLVPPRGRAGGPPRDHRWWRSVSAHPGTPLPGGGQSSPPAADCRPYDWATDPEFAGPSGPDGTGALSARGRVSRAVGAVAGICGVWATGIIAVTIRSAAL